MCVCVKRERERDDTFLAMHITENFSGQRETHAYEKLDSVFFEAMVICPPLAVARCVSKLKSARSTVFMWNVEMVVFCFVFVQVVNE